MSRLQRSLTLLAALLLGGCGGEMEEVEVGYRGPARRDPFLAAERFLENRGYDIEIHNEFRKGLPEGETVLTSAQSLTDYGMTDEILGWLGRGGHLLVLLEGGEAFTNDWAHSSSHKLKETSGEQAALLERLGVGKTEFAEGKVKFEINGRSGEVEVPSRFHWKNSAQPGNVKIIAGDADKPAIASFPRGAGRVTVVAQSHPFRNRYIGEGDHAWLLDLLVGQNNSDAVWFLRGTRQSFASMLWEHGWMALLAAAALLAVWLWKNLPRFGPLRTAQEAGPRQFSEHLALTGGFLWHHRESRMLLAPLQRAVVAAAERLGWSPDSADFCERIAERASMPPERVEAALAPRDVTDPQLFQRLMQDLQHLREIF